jgi:hypothetical protein
MISRREFIANASKAVAGLAGFCLFGGKKKSETNNIGVERDINGYPVEWLNDDVGNDDYELAKQLIENIKMDDNVGIVIPSPKSTMRIEWINLGRLNNG